MIALLLAAALAGPPQDTPRPPAFTNAESCLADRADAAVAASSGASDAAVFLLDYLCAGPVDRAAAWQRNTDMLATMKGVFEGMENNSSFFTVDVEETDVDGADPAEVDTEAGAAAFSDMFEGLNDVRVDPVTGELVVDPGASSMIAATLRTQTKALGQMMGDPRPVFLRELAGRLVLGARGRR